MILLLSLLTLCAACSHKMSSPYQPSLEGKLHSERPMAVSIELQSEYGDRTGTTIGSVSFSDGGNVVLDPPHDQWLLDGLTREFERAGFLVYDEKTDAHPHVTVRHVQFAGEIVNRESFGRRGGALAVFDVEVTFPEPRFVFERRFAATATDESRRGLDGDDLEDLLRQALGEAYAEVVLKTHALLDNGSLH